MDSMIQFYMEETEDLLQKAEECIIRLENGYSSDDVNELFRIAHTIKGSSHMVGYEDIGNVMHKIEDMLDCTRNGSLQFNQNIVSLCFEGLDIVKKMIQFKKEQEAEEMTKDLIDAASGLSRTVEALLNNNRNKEVKPETKQPAKGLVSSLMNQEPKSKNKYYITFLIEDDAPMLSPVFLMILKSIEEIGTLAYSSVTDSYFSGCSGDNEVKDLSIILCTDIEETELYTYFSLPYVDRINIVDLTRSRLEENDFCYNDSDDNAYKTIFGVFKRLYQMLFNRTEKPKENKDGLQAIQSLHCEAVNAFDRMKGKNKITTFVKDFNEFFSDIIKIYDDQYEFGEEQCSGLRTQLVRLIERANHYTKGKHIFRVFKPEANGFADRLRNFADMVDKSSTLVILIDLSNLDTLNEDEVKVLIEIKKIMKDKDIETGIIAERPDARRIINIFDSIKPIVSFSMFRSETDAILEMLYSQGSTDKTA